MDRLVAELDADRRPLARALRDFLLQVGPELHEDVKWGAPCYIGRGLVCAIAVHSDHTNLVFYHGTSLRDPKRLLDGTGKGMRHVKLHGMGDLKPAALRALVREAIHLDAA